MTQKVLPNQELLFCFAVVFNTFEVWLRVIDKIGRTHFTNVQNLLTRSHRTRKEIGVRWTMNNEHRSAVFFVAQGISQLKVFWRLLNRIKKKFWHYWFPRDSSEFWVNCYFNKLDPVGMVHKLRFLQYFSFPTLKYSIECEEVHKNPTLFVIGV